jgi:hypothetical protein
LKIASRSRAGFEDEALSKFRILLVALALVLGSYTLASAVAEMGSSDQPTFPLDPAAISAPSSRVPDWLAVLAPFRSDLEASYALAAALQAIQSGKKNAPGASIEVLRAQERVRQLLTIAPYNPELWLALALLQAQRDPRDPLLSEALKMTYFTAPNDTQLMPVRLDTATSFDALADPDVRDLVRGDVRLMLTRTPELGTAVVSAYRRASNLGRIFLQEAVQSINPSFALNPRR